MHRVLIINASPRKKGTSAMLSRECASFLQGQKLQISLLDLYEDEGGSLALQSVGTSDAIVFCGPCYVNTYPANVILFLEQIAANPQLHRGQKVYGIIQGGMPYAHTHQSGLRMLDIFARRTGMHYAGGFIIGLAALLDGRPLSSLPHGKKVQKYFRLFLERVARGEDSPDDLFERSMPKLPAWITTIMARFMNRRIDRSYAASGLDASAPSPYAGDPLL